jgi:hypothetical protein
MKQVTHHGSGICGPALGWSPSLGIQDRRDGRRLLAFGVQAVKARKQGHGRSIASVVPPDCRATIKVRIPVNQDEKVSGAWAEGRA